LPSKFPFPYSQGVKWFIECFWSENIGDEFLCPFYQRHKDKDDIRSGVGHCERAVEEEEKEGRILLDFLFKRISLYNGPDKRFTMLFFPIRPEKAFFIRSPFLYSSLNIPKYNLGLIIGTHLRSFPSSSNYQLQL